jgi:hypothetical protein
LSRIFGPEALGNTWESMAAIRNTLGLDDTVSEPPGRSQDTGGGTPEGKNNKPTDTTSDTTTSDTTTSDTTSDNSGGGMSEEDVVAPWEKPGSGLNLGGSPLNLVSDQSLIAAGKKVGGALASWAGGVKDYLLGNDGASTFDANGNEGDGPLIDGTEQPEYSETWDDDPEQAAAADLAVDEAAESQGTPTSDELKNEDPEAESQGTPTSDELKNEDPEVLKEKMPTPKSEKEIVQNAKILEESAAATSGRPQVYQLALAMSNVRAGLWSVDEFKLYRETGSITERATLEWKKLNEEWLFASGTRLGRATFSN